MDTNFKVIGLTRFGMKLESTATIEVDAFITSIRPFEVIVMLKACTIAASIPPAQTTNFYLCVGFVDNCDKNTEHETATSVSYPKL